MLSNLTVSVSERRQLINMGKCAGNVVHAAHLVTVTTYRPNFRNTLLILYGVVLSCMSFFMAGALENYDIQVTAVKNVSNQTLYMYQPHTFENGTAIVVFNIKTTTTLDTIGKPRYEIFFLTQNDKKYPLKEGKGLFDIDVSTRREYQLHLPEFSVVLPGPINNCEQWQKLCFEITAPEELNAEHHIGDSDRDNNHICVPFIGICQLPLVDISMKDVRLMHPKLETGKIFYRPEQITEIIVDLTIINLSQYFVNQTFSSVGTRNSNFDLVIIFKRENATILYQLPAGDNVNNTGSGLEPGRELLFRADTVKVNIPSSECHKIKQFCFQVRPGLYATYLDKNLTNNEVCKRSISVTEGGAGQLQCPYEILVLDFEFQPLTKHIEPGEEFMADFDITIYNASPYNLPPNKNNGNYRLHLNFISNSSNSFHKIRSNLTHLTQELGLGIMAGEERIFNDKQAFFEVPPDVCDEQDHQVCVHVSVEEHSAIFLENNAKTPRKAPECVKMFVECPGHKDEKIAEYGLPAGITCGILACVLIAAFTYLLKKRKQSILTRNQRQRNRPKQQGIGSLSVTAPVNIPRTATPTRSFNLERNSDIYDGYLWISEPSEERNTHSNSSLQRQLPPPPIPVPMPIPYTYHPPHEDTDDIDDIFIKGTNGQHEVYQVPSLPIVIDRPVLDNLPQGFTREDVTITSYIDDDNRPKITSDWMLICDMCETKIRGETSSSVNFSKKVKMKIPLTTDVTSYQDIKVLYSSRGTSGTWNAIYGNESDLYTEASRLEVQNSILEFSTIRVGVFAFLMRKNIIERHIRVYMKPIDIEANDHVFLTIYATLQEEIKNVEIEEARHGARVCSRSDVVFNLSPKSSLEVNVCVDKEPIQHFEQNEFSEKIDWSDLCKGDKKSHVEIKVYKVIMKSICTSIGGTIRVGQDGQVENSKKMRFDSEHIAREDGNSNQQRQLKPLPPYPTPDRETSVHDAYEQIQAVVLTDHEARYIDEVTLKKGDLVTVLNVFCEHGDGWCEVELEDKRKGLFPSNLLQIIESRQKNEDVIAAKIHQTQGYENEKMPMRKLRKDVRDDITVPIAIDRPILVNLPQGVAKEQVTITSYIDDDNRPMITSDWMLVCDMIKTEMHGEASSRANFSKQVKMKIPLTTVLPSFQGFKVMFSSIGTPDTWKSIFGDYSDYTEASRLDVKNSVLEFSTMRVGIFAFLMRKTVIERHIRVFMEPRDISSSDHIFLTIYATLREEIKNVEEEEADHDAYVCSHSNVVVDLSPNSCLNVKILVDKEPIPHFQQYEFSEKIDRTDLCKGDTQSHVRVKVHKVRTKSNQCTSIGGTIRVGQGENYKKMRFDSQRIPRETRGKEPEQECFTKETYDNLRPTNGPSGSGSRSSNAQRIHHGPSMSRSPSASSVHVFEQPVVHMQQPFSSSRSTSLPVIVESPSHAHHYVPFQGFPNADRSSVQYVLPTMQHLTRPVESHHEEYGHPRYDDHNDRIIEDVVPDQQTGSYKHCHVKYGPPTQEQLSPVQTEFYNMLHSRKGLAYILNNLEFRCRRTQSKRLGSDVDFENMQHLSAELGYEKEVHENLSAEGIKQTMKKFAERIENSEVRYQSCLVVLMSHGNGDGIFGVDDKLVELKKLCELFDVNKCPKLRDKPKLFIVQACRTQPHQQQQQQQQPQNQQQPVSGASIQRQTVARDAPPPPPETLIDKKVVAEKTDIHVAFACTEGSYSLRHEITGSWFVQAILEVFLAHAHEDHLEDMMVKVRRRVTCLNGRMYNPDTKQTEVVTQTPQSVTSLTRKMFFFPKYPPES